jgi:hypothetical protein
MAAEATEVCARIALALQHSLLPDATARQQAEQALRRLERAPQAQYLVCLFRIVVDPTLDVVAAVRQAGAIALKILVVRRWDASQPEERLVEEEKAIIRANMLEGLVHATPIVRTQLGLSLKAIAYSDFPQAWPGLLEAVLINLQAGEQRTLGALYAQRMLVKKYEYKTGVDREPLRQVRTAGGGRARARARGRAECAHESESRLVGCVWTDEGSGAWAVAGPLRGCAQAAWQSWGGPLLGVGNRSCSRAQQSRARARSAPGDACARSSGRHSRPRATRVQSVPRVGA